MSAERDARLAAALAEHGLAFEAENRPGANYLVAVEDGDELWISGQIPRVDGRLASAGAAGGEASLAEARRAAVVAVLRALTIAQRQLGTLTRVRRVRRMTVYVHSTTGFTEHSEVADAASAIVHMVFAPDGGHTRTSVGVAQLPKNATVEIDMVMSIAPPGARTAGGPARGG